MKNQSVITAEQNYKQTIEKIEKRMLYKVVTGSKAYGLSNSDSDLDIRGIFLGSMEDRLLTYNHKKKLDAFKTKDDDTLYFELNKFAQLVHQQSLNIIELLFVEPSCVIYTHPLFNDIINMRDTLLTKKISYSLLNTARSEYDIVLSQQSNNPKRKDLILNYGYDTKSASHSIRILDYCPSLFTQGIFSLKNEHQDIILNLKNGHYSLNEYKDIYQKFLDRALSANNDLPDELPASFDNKLLNIYCFVLIKITFSHVIIENIFDT